MGATDSKQKLGERVIAAKKKLEDDVKVQSERVKDIKSKAPETIKVIINSVAESFKTYSPFLESVLLTAWEIDPEECGKIVLNSCVKVLNAPIKKEEYEWFMKYVFPSSIWMFKTKTNRFMYEELIDTTNNMQQGIVDSMNSIYSHLESHPKWNQLLNIANQDEVIRQDDPKVGLLQELEMKQMDDTFDDVEAFMDSNLAVNILTTTAKNINKEFQNHIQAVMSHYGKVRSGPVKKVERCVSKLENDYQNEAYPKAAKLLDLVRCSVTFNTLDQLVAGYNGLIKHINKHSSSIKLARVKNGFLDKGYSGGYRDIKVNIIYHSSINPDIKMICEVQLLLGQYLHEKKRIHKLYSIVRQEEYFKMIVADNDEKKKKVVELRFEPVLNVTKQVKENNIHHVVGKCTVDSSLGLLAVESHGNISCIDIKEKKVIFTKKRETTSYNESQTHRWVVIDRKKYLAVQWSVNKIRFFKVNPNDNSFIEAKELEICLDKNDTITCCEFDEHFEHIILVKNSKILEKRRVSNSNNVLVGIKMGEEITPDTGKVISLSNDGKWCVIGGGMNNAYFYLIEIDKKVQHKVISTNLTDGTFCPCFVNGVANFCVVGGTTGKFEVWDVKKRILIKLLQLETTTTTHYVSCLTSSNNILAVGSCDYKLSLWDIHTWKMFWSETYNMQPQSVYLTDDLKYVVMGGVYGEKCLVLEIK